MPTATECSRHRRAGAQESESSSKRISRGCLFQHGANDVFAFIDFGDHFGVGFLIQFERAAIVASGGPGGWAEADDGVGFPGRGAVVGATFEVSGGEVLAVKRYSGGVGGPASNLRREGGSGESP